MCGPNSPSPTFFYFSFLLFFFLLFPYRQMAAAVGEDQAVAMPEFQQLEMQLQVVVQQAQQLHAALSAMGMA